jgi:cytochrome c oxidase assembly factor CtaG
MTILAHSNMVTNGWHWEGSVILGCVLLAVGYLWLTGWRWTNRTSVFMLGLATLLVALVSPLHTLADSYLFSAHMLQHLALLQAVPPLLILGLPPNRLSTVLKKYRPLRRLEKLVARPPVSWFLALAMLYIWHFPALYDAAINDHNLHIFQHLTFLVTATLFWWPVLAPVEKYRFAPLLTILYLLAAAIVSSILGITLSFTPSLMYAAYVAPTDSEGWLWTIRQRWGITPLLDQQLGGLFMWTLGNPAFFVGVIIVIARWYTAAQAEERRLGELSEVGVAAD